MLKAPWSSVTDNAQDESSRAITVAQEAEATAQKAQDAAKAVVAIASKAEGSFLHLDAALNEAKQAASDTEKYALELRNLRKVLQQSAREAAFATIPETVEKMMEAAHKEATDHVQSQDLSTKLMLEAPEAGKRAMVPYEEAMVRDAKIAKEYHSMGEQLESAAVSEHKAAVDAEARANKLMRSGQTGAKDAIAESRGLINKEFALTKQAGWYYKRANVIQESLAKYGEEAQQAAYFQEKMLDPSAEPPLTPRTFLGVTP